MFGFMVLILSVFQGSADLFRIRFPAPESRKINKLDPGLCRGDEQIGVSAK